MTQRFDLNFHPQTDKPKASKIITGLGFQMLSVCFASGQVMPAHTHPGMNVLVHVVRGSFDLISEGQKISVAAGQIVLFSGDTAHALENSMNGQTNIVVTAIPKSS